MIREHKGRRSPRPSRTSHRTSTKSKLLPRRDASTSRFVCPPHTFPSCHRQRGCQNIFCGSSVTAAQLTVSPLSATLKQKGSGFLEGERKTTREGDGVGGWGGAEPRAMLEVNDVLCTLEVEFENNAGACEYLAGLKGGRRGQADLK